MAEYKTINEITNVSTQANDDDLLIMWDKNREKTVKIKNKDFNKNNQPKTLETPIEVDNVEESTVEGALGAINDKVKNFTAGVAFKGTRSAYNNAKLIPEGSDGHIPSGALVIITDEGKTYVTNGTGSSQTLELVANATFNGSHAEWNALTLAQKAMYNIVNFNDDEGIELKTVVYDDETIGLHLVKKGNVVQGSFRHNVTGTERTIIYQNVIPAEFRTNPTGTTYPRAMLINNSINKPIGQAIFGYDGNLALWTETAGVYDGSEFIAFITYLV